jgi:hypothetical protein
VNTAQPMRMTREGLRFSVAAGSYRKSRVSMVLQCFSGYA